MKLLFKRWALAFIAPRPLIGLIYLRRYLGDWFRFSAMAPAESRLRWTESYPCLTDWVPATLFDPHYFHQGAWLARHLKKSNAGMHVDVGSSVMMVSVLSAHVPMVFVALR